MARVKSMFRKAALNSIDDRLFTIFEGDDRIQPMKEADIH